MSFFTSLIALWLLLLGSSSGITTPRSESEDLMSKSDLDAVHILLEKHYSLHGEYPTEKELTNEYETALPGVDPELLLDTSGALISTENSRYSYRPLECTSLGCKHFSLTALLSDGTEYEKKSVR